MSFRYQNYIRCETPDCFAEKGPLMSVPSRRLIPKGDSDARVMAGFDGWTRDGGKDYCPECSKRRAK